MLNNVMLNVDLLEVQHLFFCTVHPGGYTTVDVWSDGPSTHFKNRYMEWFVADAYSAMDVHFCWDFFSAMHGKGPSDSEGMLTTCNFDC